MTWWFIDELKFDQQFISLLSLIGSVLTLFGMFLFRRFMADHSIAYVVGFLTVLGGLLSLPYVGMVFGLHQWTAAATGGVVDARFIALVNTALESPLGQIAMIPMLAWIANSAPNHPQSHLFCGDGLVHQSRTVRLFPRHQVPQPDLCSVAGGQVQGWRGHYAGRLQPAR